MDNNPLRIQTTRSKETPSLDKNEDVPSNKTAKSKDRKLKNNEPSKKIKTHTISDDNSNASATDSMDSSSVEKMTDAKTKTATESRKTKIDDPISRQEWLDIKKQIAMLAKSVDGIVPVVESLKNKKQKNQRPTLQDVKDSPNERHEEDIETVEDSPNERQEEDTEMEEGEIIEPSLNYLGEVAGTSKPEGPKIHEQVAKATTKLLTEGLAPKMKDKLFSEYETPENCPRLEVIECNKTIYQNASKSARLRDGKLQETQKGMLQGLNVLTFTYDHILRAKTSNGLNSDDTNVITNMLADAMALIADTSHGLDITRRRNFQPEFKEEFNQLCNNSYPVQDKLFGRDDTLPEKVKDVTETLKVSHRVNKQNRFNPFQGNRSTFLGQGQRFNHQNQNHFSNFRNYRGGFQAFKRYQQQRQQYFRNRASYTQNNNPNQRRRFNQQRK